MTIDRRAWFSPGIIIHIATALLMIGVTYGVMSSRMEVVTAQLGEMRVELREFRSAQNDVIRAQERMAFLVTRIEALERFKDGQESINVRVFSGLSKLGG